MKTKKLLLSVVFLIAFQLIYAQALKTKTIFEKNNSHITIEKSQESTNKICRTIFSFDGRSVPTGLAWDGQNFWYTDTGYLYKVSPAGLYLDSIVNPAPEVFFLKGGDLTYDGTNLWYADEQSAMLFKIDPSSKVITQFSLPFYGDFDPNGFSITWDGTNLWHNRYDDTRILFKLSPVDASVIDTVVLDHEILTLEWVKGELYGMGENKLYKINTATGMVTDSLDWCVPFSLGLAWDGTAYWNVSGPSVIFGIPTGGENKVFKMNADVNLAIDKKMNKNEVTIFPNPASESIFVKGNGMQSIEIYDVTGTLVYSLMNIRQTIPVEINISLLPKGLYFTKIYEQSGIYTKRLVVQ